MRNVFIVLAKLIGILQLYWGISYLAALNMTYSQMKNIQLSKTIPQDSDGIQILPILGYILLTFSMSYLLIICTEWLADILRIKENEDYKKLPINLILQAGIKLIGIYIVALAIPQVFKSLSEWVFTVKQYSSSMHDSMHAQGFFSSIVPLLLKICLGLFATLKTNTIIRIITKDQKAEQSSAPIPNKAQK